MRSVKKRECTSKSRTRTLSWRWSGDLPTVLSLGRPCDDISYSYTWTPIQISRLTNDGVLIECYSENYVRILTERKIARILAVDDSHHPGGDPLARVPITFHRRTFWSSKGNDGWNSRLVRWPHAVTNQRWLDISTISVIPSYLMYRIVNLFSPQPFLKWHIFVSEKKKDLYEMKSKRMAIPVIFGCSWLYQSILQIFHENVRSGNIKSAKIYKYMFEQIPELYQQMITCLTISHDKLFRFPCGDTTTMWTYTHHARIHSENYYTKYW